MKNNNVRRTALIGGAFGAGLPTAFVVVQALNKLLCLALSGRLPLGQDIVTVLDRTWWRSTEGSAMIGLAMVTTIGFAIVWAKEARELALGRPLRPRR